ncbi:hypothetical protein [Vibrio parahaemolyticus]|uniref:hypothetical protein n=1 Tax=Vibrio parahaemolyticus TaxID=670 RepID=UPI002B3E3165|nr:hypothetical protein [Vibrio harveyi]
MEDEIEVMPPKEVITFAAKYWLLCEGAIRPLRQEEREKFGEFGEWFCFSSTSRFFLATHGEVEDKKYRDDKERGISFSIGNREEYNGLVICKWTKKEQDFESYMKKVAFAFNWDSESPSFDLVKNEKAMNAVLRAKAKLEALEMLKELK